MPGTLVKHADLCFSIGTSRIRDFKTGVVVSNVSATLEHCFVSAFPDYENDRLVLRMYGLVPIMLWTTSGD